MGGVLRKPIAVDSLQSLHEEAWRLLDALRRVVDSTQSIGGVTNGIHLRYGSIHNQILQINRILKPMIDKKDESWIAWFYSWQQEIETLEARYHLVRRAGLSRIQELEEPMLPMPYSTNR